MFSWKLDHGEICEQKLSLIYTPMITAFMTPVPLMESGEYLSKVNKFWCGSRNFKFDIETLPVD